jgi:Fe-coproporphyrin III synthase
MSVDLKETPQPHTIESGKLTSLPILLLNVHENCNCRCLMCDIWKRPPGSQLEPASLMRHRDSIKALRIRQVVLTGGEPLLHSSFDALCSFLQDCGVRVTLLTTGLLLTKRAESVAAGVDEVIISLDGPEAVHDEIRRVNRGFDLIRSGIAAVRQHRPDMPVQARSTVQRANFLFLRETVSAAKRLGFDSISFLATDVSSHAFNRELIWPGERQDQVALSPSEIASLESEVELLIEQFSEEIACRYIVESPRKLRHIARRFREHLGQFAPEAPLCNAPWVSAVMEIDGSIRPCFFHPRIGSIGTGSLEDAINSESAQEFRRTLNVAQNPTCQRCVCSLNYRRD